MSLEKLNFMSNGKEIIYKINDTETENASVEFPLNMHRTESSEATFASEIPNIINKKTVNIAPGQEKNSFKFK